MAAQSHDSDDIMTGINVTPLVDVTLVLLVVLMITASYVVSKSIPMTLPKSATGEATPSAFSVSIDTQGALFLDAKPIDERNLRSRMRSAHAQNHDVQAVISAD